MIVHPKLLLESVEAGFGVPVAGLGLYSTVFFQQSHFMLSGLTGHSEWPVSVRVSSCAPVMD